MITFSFIQSKMLLSVSGKLTHPFKRALHFFWLIVCLWWPLSFSLSYDSNNRCVQHVDSNCLTSSCCQNNDQQPFKLQTKLCCNVNTILNLFEPLITPSPSLVTWPPIEKLKLASKEFFLNRFLCCMVMNTDAFQKPIP